MENVLERILIFIRTAETLLLRSFLECSAVEIPLHNGNSLFHNASAYPRPRIARLVCHINKKKYIKYGKLEPVFIFCFISQSFTRGRHRSYESIQVRAAGSLAASVERRQPVRGEIIDFYVAPATPVKLSRMFRRGNPLA